MVKKTLSPKLINYILKNDRKFGYLETLKELYRLGFSLEEISLIKKNDLIMRKLNDECRDKHLLKKDRVKKNY